MNDAARSAARGGYSIWVPGATFYPWPLPEAKALKGLPWTTHAPISRLPVEAQRQHKGRQYPKQSAFALSIAKRSAASPQPPFNDTMNDAHLRNLMTHPRTTQLPIIALRRGRASTHLTPEPAAGFCAFKYADKSPDDLDDQRIRMSTREARKHFHSGPLDYLRTAQATAPRAGNASTKAKDSPRGGSDGIKPYPRSRLPTVIHFANSPVLVPPWPTRHAEPPPSWWFSVPENDIVVECRCRRPVGDVAHCPHSSMHLRVRRWARQLRNLFKQEAVEWEEMCNTSHEAATKYITSVNQRRIGAMHYVAPAPDNEVAQRKQSTSIDEIAEIRG